MGIMRADFLAKLRRRLGNPSTTELADDMLSDAADFALNDFSQCKPLRSALLITLQPGQERYTLVPEPKYILDVVPSAPTTASARAFGNEFRAIELDLVSFAIPDLLAHFEKISQYREMFEQVDWRYDEPPILYVSPSPVQALQCIVITGDTHTLGVPAVVSPPADEIPDTVGEEHFDTLIRGAMAYAMDAWAMQRDSLSVMTIPSSAGSIGLTDGRILREQAEKHLKYFRQKIGWDLPFIGQG